MKKVILFLSLTIVSLFLLNDIVSADAVIISDSPNTTFINSNGEVTSGPTIKSLNKQIIPISYIGNNIIADMTSQTVNGQEVAFESMRAHAANTVIRIKNVGFYKGEPLTLAFKNTQGAMYVLYENGGLGIQPSGMNIQHPIYNVWFENNKKEIINEQDISFVFPVTSSDRLGVNAGEYFQTSYNNSNGIDRFIVNPSIDSYDGYYLSKNYIDFTNSGLNVLNLNNGSYMNLIYNIMYTPSLNTGKPLIIDATYYVGTYPNGMIKTGNTLMVNSISFFQSNTPILIPLDNPVPAVLDTYVDDQFKGKLSINQIVYRQSQNQFYKDLDLNIELPKFVPTEDLENNLIVRDNNNNNITNDVSISSKQNGLLTITFPKELLQQLGNNILEIEGLFELSDSYNDMIPLYDLTNHRFNIPIKVQNSDNSLASQKTGTSFVNMPAPTGDPVEQIVYKGNSTSSMNPSQFVSNLRSVLNDETVKAIAFSEEKTFEQLGSNSVKVIIESELTKVTNEIEVPVTVVLMPEDTGSLSWSNDEVVPDKNQELDKSDIGDKISLDIYWKTNLQNRDYEISIEDSQGNQIDSFNVSNANNVDTFLLEKIEIPTDKLAYGNNNIIVKLSTKGSPPMVLDSVNLSINLTGSLRLTNIPDVFKWTNRTVYDSKGILSRDKDNTMTLGVVDTRNLDTDKKNWVISAVMETKGTLSSNLDLLWKDNASSDSFSLKTEQRVLTSETAIKNGDYYQNSWDSESGVLLNSSEYLRIGNYSDNISVSWNLYDTLQPE